MKASKVKYPDQADQGRLNVELAERNMGALMQVRKRFAKERPFHGLTIGMALHVTKETAVLVRTLRDGGARVVITGCNPLSTQDDVAAALAQEEGVEVFAHRGESKDEYYAFLRDVVMSKPDITIDDGCDLVTEIHQNSPELLESIIGGCEETTTGVLRLRAMVKAGMLKYPVVAVNDNKTKHLMDNYYGTGQSTLDGLLRAANLLFAGKTLVVIGYGSCGKGVALRGRGMGANVIVAEVDAFCALQARMDGFRVMPLSEAVKEGDIYVTVTGNVHVIDWQHILAMKDGAVLANSGHFDNEINMKALEEHSDSKRRVRPCLDEYTVHGKNIFVAGEGRLVNLAAAEGHPSEVMSLSFCGQALACEYLVKNRGKLAAGVVTLPEQVDDEISQLQLKAMGLKIDCLTDEQRKYLTSWEHGT
ncbi:MAG: adenosylhomocysteinase [bacterium]|nr:adenosylhomocysteinase [bacterium]